MAKLLVVDDEKIICKRLKKLLVTGDYDVVTAEDGNAALEVFAKEKPDIVILDIETPGMEGIEVLNAIKARSPKTEIIMVTGHGDVKSAMDALRGGAFGYIQKPIEYNTLEFEIRKALEKQNTQRQLDKSMNDLLKAEKVARQKAQDWETTFNSIKEMVSIIDKDYKYVSVNKVFADMLNMKPEEMLGKKCFQLRHNIKRILPNCPAKLTFKNNSPHTTSYLDSKLGCFVEETASPIFNEKGELDRVVIVMKDISERKWEEGENSLRNEFEAIKKMIITYNHEMNQPLTTIDGYIDILLDEVDKKSENYKMLKIMSEQSMRAKKILDQIKRLDTFTSKEYIPGSSMIDLKLDEEK